MSAVTTPTTAAERLVLTETTPLLVGGDEVSAGRSFEAIDPSTGRPWATVGQAAAADVDRAVETARRAFADWRRTTPAQRQEVLWRIADRVLETADRWPRLLATENGRPIREAELIDVPVTSAIYRYFSGIVRDVHGEVIATESASSLVYTTREPLGVVAALIPWNSPLISLAHKIAPALAAGNTVVVKPSEFASVGVVEFVRAIADLVPPGVVNVVTGDGPEAGAALVAHPDVAKVSFTGGTETGRRILSAAGQQLTPALMELGGKGAFVVCPDADVETAVTDAMTGIFAANGQVCFASSRLLVHEDVFDEVCDRFVDVTRRVRVGDALDPSTEVGPLVSEAHRRGVTERLEHAVAEGAQLRIGGDHPVGQGECAGGFFFSPTVLVDRGGTTRASCEEFFGPVLVVESWTDEDEVVARANATPYGLAQGVWTRDLARAHRIAAGLESGMVWVNTWFDTPLGQPQGGVGASGFGREGAAETLREYSATRVVNVSLDTARPPMWGNTPPDEDRANDNGAGR